MDAVGNFKFVLRRNRPAFHQVGHQLHFGLFANRYCRWRHAGIVGGINSYPIFLVDIILNRLVGLSYCGSAGQRGIFDPICRIFPPEWLWWWRRFVRFIR